MWTAVLKGGDCGAWADQATVEVMIACYMHNDDEADFHIYEPETTASILQHSYGDAFPMNSAIAMTERCTPSAISLLPAKAHPDWLAKVRELGIPEDHQEGTLARVSRCVVAKLRGSNTPHNFSIWR
jgi:hypothetical protein